MPLDELRNFAVLKYEDCSVEELRRFIRARKGACPSKFLKRVEYVKRLMILDRDRTFRFTDLCPEIRNIIYQMVLSTYNDEHGVFIRAFKGLRPEVGPLGASIAYPALLLASKSINQEASGYLNDGVVAYSRDYRGVVIPERRPCSVRNVTIFLQHWCSNDNEEVGDLVKYHVSSKPLKTLKICMATNCSAYTRRDAAAIEKMLLPLKGLLPKTDVQLVGFPALVEKVARDVLAGDSASVTKPMLELPASPTPSEECGWSIHE